MTKVFSLPAFLGLLMIVVSGCSISIDIRRPVEADGQVEALMQRYFDAFNAAAGLKWEGTRWTGALVELKVFN